VSISNPKRAFVAIVSAVALIYAGWYCVTVGYARTLDRVALFVGNRELADNAAAISPGDAEVHEARAEILRQSGEHSESAAALDRAIKLRPRYYYLWVELGLAREVAGDEEGAIRSLRHAVTLAPAYANVHWHLGNVLLRTGRLDEGFAELRRAGSRNPTLLPGVYDLAWGVYQPDAVSVVTAAGPQTDFERLTLAIVFAKHGKNTAAIEQFALAGEGAKKEEQELLGLLLQSGAFFEAYRVWTKLHGGGNAETGSGVLHNGGFEEPLLLGDPGFAWQITPGLLNVVMSVDEALRQSGTKSLRVEFRGNSAPQTAALTQTLLVKSGSHYRLSFFVRGHQLVSAALPVVVVSDASIPGTPVLSQSTPVRSDSEEWQEVTMEVAAGAQTQAIVVAITRQACANDPCPAFGTVWFDSFNLAQSGTVPLSVSPKKD